MSFIKRVTCLAGLVGTLVMVRGAAGLTSVTDLWSKFEVTRKGARDLQQTFDVSRSFKSGYDTQTSQHEITVDLFQGKWREQHKGGSGELARIFDGQDLFAMESGGAEYLRAARNGDKNEHLPEPYDIKLDWQNAKEVSRQPCGFTGQDHDCFIVDAPVKPSLQMSLPGEVTTITGGVSRIMIDPESGAWLVCHVTETIEQGSGLTYQLDITYSVKHMTYVAAPDPALFRLPDNLHEVHELARWDEKRIKKELLGKPAPGLQVTDIRGNHLSLADLRGKTVLLDFWTTWCPPCRADAPILDELNQKYGKDLTIIGVSVDEDRATVKKFLEKHPHAFPVVLSTENSMPRPYQIGVFPTYLIIGPDGTITAAEQGDQGFSRLRKSLEKAGMQME